MEVHPLFSLFFLCLCFNAVSLKPPDPEPHSPDEYITGNLTLFLIHDQKTLHTSTSLTTTKNALRTLKNMTENLLTLLEVDNEADDKALTNELDVTKNLLSEIDIYEKISLAYAELFSTEARNKRSIDLLGEILNVVAGTPTKAMHNSLSERVSDIEKSALNLQDVNKLLAANEKHLANGLGQVQKQLDDTLTLLKNHNKRIDKIETVRTRIFETLDFLSLSSKVNSLAASNIRKIESIYAASKNHQLSPFAIPPHDLFTEVRRLTYDPNPLVPIYKRSVEKYYSGKFTRGSWIRETLHITMGIPLIMEKEQYYIQFLSDKEKMQSPIDLSSYAAKAINPKTNGFIFLTNTDIRKCAEFLPRKLMCKKRPLEITSPDLTVYEISSEVFLINLGERNQTTAKIFCDGFQTTYVIRSGIHHLGVHCAVSHPEFRIEKTKQELGSYIRHNEPKIDINFKQSQHKNRSRESTKSSTLLQKIMNDTENHKKSIRNIMEETDDLSYRIEKTREMLKSHKEIDSWTKGGFSAMTLIPFLFLLYLYLSLRSEVNRMKFGK